MAFVLTLQPGDHNPISVLQGNDEYLAIIRVGYDDQSGDIVSIMTAFSPIPGYDPGEFELAFSMMRASADEARIDEFWDGLATKAIIPDRRDRATVRAVLLAAIRELVDGAKPSLLMMTTHTPNLPPSGLRKFHEIAGLLEELGFKASRADPWHGHHIWMARREIAAPQRDRP